MLKLIDIFGLWDVLADNFSRKPVWGICAGSILMANKVWVDETRQQAQKSFGLMPVDIIRNGYGRQLESHHAVIAGYEVSFIRAPIVTNFANDVEVLGSADNVPVWLRYKDKMLATFHAELTTDYPSPMHKAFVESVQY
jgi:5'-phosphate synthase pdxT subunit